MTSVELVETALSIAPIVRRPPDYPPDALKQRLGGHVQLKFDVTAAGVVENVSVVESSDAQFEDAAVRAVSEWRYLPRIVAGKRVAASGHPHDHPVGSARRRRIRRPTNAKRTRSKSAAMRDCVAFSGGLEVALDRLAADDLRGAELQLDEMQAVYRQPGDGDIWSFYGYLYTVQGNYDRAIDAYETGRRRLARNAGTGADGAMVPLANLYFARHQYDLALKTLLRPQEANRMVRRRIRRPFALERRGRSLIERLRALGVTEDEPLSLLDASVRSRASTSRSAR